MTKAHELDRSKQTDAAASGPDDGVAPGRIARSAALTGPNGFMPSGLIQRKARDANGVEDGAGDAVARASSSSSGAALPEGLMRKFEASLGADLSGVRVHTGGESADAASAVGAKAYTLGQDIHFGAGHFDPSSTTGEHLLAHEVAHTVQQRGGVARVQLKPAVSSPGDTHEIEADRAADQMVAARPAMVERANGDTALHREPERFGTTQTGPATKNDSKAATPAQIAKLKALSGKIQSLDGKATTTTASLRGAVGSEMAMIDTGEANLSLISASYDAAYKRHEAALKTAEAEVEAEDKMVAAVLAVVLSAAGGYALGAVLDATAMEEGLTAIKAEVSTAMDGVEAGAVNKGLDAAADAPKTLIEKGTEGATEPSATPGGPLAGALPAVKELAVVKQVSAAKSTLLRATMKLVDLGPLDRAISDLVKDIAVYTEKGTGTSQQLPVEATIMKAEKISQHAPAAYSKAAAVMASSGKKISALVAALAQCLSLGNFDERIWVEWLSHVSLNAKNMAVIKKLLGGSFLSPRLLPPNVMQKLQVEGSGDANLAIRNAGLAQRAINAIGKTGLYRGTSHQGVITLDGDEYTARVQDGGSSDAHVSFQAIVLSEWDMLDKKADADTNNAAATQRYGVLVKSAEAREDKSEPEPYSPDPEVTPKHVH